MALDHEPVHLCLRERVDPLRLDGVQGRDDHERVRQLEGRSLDRDLSLLHRLQQGGLGLRGRPVDLIREEQVGEDRPLPDLELGALLVVEVVARDVRREQVLGELDPAVRQARHLGEHLRERGLRHPGDALHEQVTVGQQAGEEVVDLFLVPDDHFAYLGLHPPEYPFSLLGGHPLAFVHHPPTSRSGCPAAEFSDGGSAAGALCPPGQTPALS